MRTGSPALDGLGRAEIESEPAVVESPRWWFAEPSATPL
jgi:hypothetical protein